MQPIHHAMNNIAEFGGFKDDPANDLAYLAFIPDAAQFRAMVANVNCDRVDFEIMRLRGQSLATLEYIAPFDPVAHREFIRRREESETSA